MTRDNFPMRVDGVADESDAIQQAIDKVQEAVTQGIVFIQEGLYHIAKTVPVSKPF